MELKVLKITLGTASSHGYPWYSKFKVTLCKFALKVLKVTLGTESFHSYPWHSKLPLALKVSIVILGT